MGRSLKKGPYVVERLLEKVYQGRRRRQPRADQDLGAGLHDRARVHRQELRDPQRPELHQAVRDRGHGRAQARRVRPDPDLPGPRRQGVEVVGPRSNGSGRDVRRRSRRTARPRPGPLSFEPASRDPGHEPDTRLQRDAPLRPDLGAEAPAAPGPDPRQVRRRRPGHPQVHAPPRGPDDRAGAQERHGQRRGQGGPQRRRPGHRRRPGRRRPDVQAADAAGPGHGVPDPPPHAPHRDRPDRPGEADRGAGRAATSKRPAAGWIRRRHRRTTDAIEQQYTSQGTIDSWAKRFDRPGSAWASWRTGGAAGTPPSTSSATSWSKTSRSASSSRRSTASPASPRSRSSGPATR